MNATTGKWAKVPIEALQDQRLSATELRVLIGLLSFASPDGRLMYVKRQTLADRCNVHLSQVTRATAALARYGWLHKSGNGGKSRPASYQVTPPFTWAKSSQVKPPNLSEIVTNTCAESCHQTCDDFAQGKEQPIEQPIEQSAPPKLLTALIVRARKLDDHGIDRFARETGIAARPTETYWAFKKRLVDEVFPQGDRQRLREFHSVLDAVERG